MTPSTPTGAIWRIRDATSSPRRTTSSAPNPATSSSSANDASAITTSPSALANCTAIAAEGTGGTCHRNRPSSGECRDRRERAERSGRSSRSSMQRRGRDLQAHGRPRPPGARRDRRRPHRSDRREGRPLSPGRRRAAKSPPPGPIASTTPAASIPGTYGFGRPSSRAEVAPERNPVSVGLTAAAWTRMRISPGPGVGSGMSWTCSTSGPPNSVRPTARIVLPFRKSRLAGDGRSNNRN